MIITECATVSDSALSVLSDVGLPAAAIIISTLVAVFLARGERKASREARLEEEQERARERRRVERDQALDRIFAVLEDGPEGSPDGSEGTSVLHARRLRIGVGRLRVALQGQEVELTDWLEAEAQWLAIVHAAARLGRRGSGVKPLAPGSHQALVLLWNSSLNNLGERLMEYEAPGGGSQLVAAWRADVDARLANPSASLTT